MCTLSGSSNLNLSNCQLNDAQDRQRFNNKTYNNCHVTILSTSLTMSLNLTLAIPSDYPDRLVISSDHQLTNHMWSLWKGSTSRPRYMASPLNVHSLLPQTFEPCIERSPGEALSNSRPQ
ncbi:hypothetical protein PTI98_010291 [Pleurotus ostreatus]|nr:hypothetical protein PTI98_010291 [Pleurotus ostreatus]